VTVSARKKRRPGAPRVWLVIRKSTGAEAHRVEVTGQRERAVEKIERGLLRQMYRDAYYVVQETEADTPEGRNRLARELLAQEGIDDQTHP